MKEFTITNDKDIEQYQQLIKTYFVMLFKKSQQKIIFDVSLQNQKMLRPSTPS